MIGFLLVIFPQISIHSLRMEGDTGIHQLARVPVYFNPLPPHGGRRIRATTSIRYCWISIHSLRMEGDTGIHQLARVPVYFNPLPPHGGRQNDFLADDSVYQFQSTPSAWRETVTKCVPLDMTAIFQSTPSAWRETLRNLDSGSGVNISIHSLRMEGDIRLNIYAYSGRYFNPLPPHGGRPPPEDQPTPCSNISIHSLRMEGDVVPSII